MSSGKSKAEFVADVLNKTLYQLVIRCTRSEGVRNYFDVGVVAYGGAGVGSGFKGPLASGVLHSLSAIEANVLRVEERKRKVDDGAGGLFEQVVKFPVWFEPTHNGGTPMCDGLREAAAVLVKWCDSHPNSYPPTIIHVTDGQSSDGDPSNIAEDIKLISTNDGPCLMFNLHIDTGTGETLMFPNNQANLPDTFSKLLFRMSSEFPPHLIHTAKEKGHNVGPDSRFFAYRSGIEGIVDFFDIGTRAENLR